MYNSLPLSGLIIAWTKESSSSSAVSKPPIELSGTLFSSWSTIGLYVPSSNALSCATTLSVLIWARLSLYLLKLSTKYSGLLFTRASAVNCSISADILSRFWESNPLDRLTLLSMFLSRTTFLSATVIWP